MKKKISYDEALRIAQKYETLLAPACERLEIAGSLRRKESVVGDIEMVAIPRLVDEPVLFGEPWKKHSLLNDAVVSLITKEGARLLKNGERYKQIALAEGMTLDLFIVLPPAQWGVIFAIRTGPRWFSKVLVTPRPNGYLPFGYKVRDGAVWRGGEIIPMPEEEDFFRLLGIWLSAEERKQPQSPKPFITKEDDRERE